MGYIESWDKRCFVEDVKAKTQEVSAGLRTREQAGDSLRQDVAYRFGYDLDRFRKNVLGLGNNVTKDAFLGYRDQTMTHFLYKEPECSILQQAFALPPASAQAPYTNLQPPISELATHAREAVNAEATAWGRPSNVTAKTEEAAAAHLAIYTTYLLPFDERRRDATLFSLATKGTADSLSADVAFNHLREFFSWKGKLNFSKSLHRDALDATRPYMSDIESLWNVAINNGNGDTKRALEYGLTSWRKHVHRRLCDQVADGYEITLTSDEKTVLRAIGETALDHFDAEGAVMLRKTKALSAKVANLTGDLQTIAKIKMASLSYANSKATEDWLNCATASQTFAVTADLATEEWEGSAPISFRKNVSCSSSVLTMFAELAESEHLEKGASGVRAGVLVGPADSGKRAMAEAFARALKCPFIAVGHGNVGDKDAVAGSQSTPGQLLQKLLDPRNCKDSPAVIYVNLSRIPREATTTRQVLRQICATGDFASPYLGTRLNLRNNLIIFACEKEKHLDAYDNELISCPRAKHNLPEIPSRDGLGITPDFTRLAQFFFAQHCRKLRDATKTGKPPEWSLSKDAVQWFVKARWEACLDAGDDEDLPINEALALWKLYVTELYDTLQDPLGGCDVPAKSELTAQVLAKALKEQMADYANAKTGGEGETERAAGTSDET